MALLSCALALAACGGASAPGSAGPDSIKTGTYRVVLQLPGGELPFGLDLERSGPDWTAFLINGPERLKVSEVTVDGSHLEIKMPGYENRLAAAAKGGQLEGEVVLNKPGDKDQHLPLRAQFEQTYRFFPQPSGAMTDVSGRWSVTFSTDDGQEEAAVGEFSQRGRSARFIRDFRVPPPASTTRSSWMSSRGTSSNYWPRLKAGRERWLPSWTAPEAGRTDPRETDVPYQWVIKVGVVLELAPR
jgi:hypothetical protein